MVNLSDQFKQDDILKKGVVLYPDTRKEIDILRFVLSGIKGYSVELGQNAGRITTQHYMYDSYVPDVLVIREENTTREPSATVVTYVLEVSKSCLMVVSRTERSNTGVVTMCNTQYPYILLPDGYDKMSKWSYKSSKNLTIHCRAIFISRMLNGKAQKTLMVSRFYNGMVTTEVYYEGSGIQEIIVDFEGMD